MKKQIRRISLVSITFVTLILLASSIFVTYENEYKLIRRFGKVERVITEPGLNFRLPFLDIIKTIPKEIQIYDLPSSDVITMDKKTMISDSFALWEVENPHLFDQTLGSSIRNAESRIDTAVYNSIKNVISSLPQSEVISSRDGVLTKLIMENIDDNLHGYGINLLTVEIKQLDMPEDNKNAVFGRMISERDKIAATYLAEGNSQAQIIRNTTDKEIAINVSSAEAKADRIIAEGEAEYMSILSEAYNSEEKADFYSFVRSLDAAKVSLEGDNKTLILPADSPIAKIFIGEWLVLNIQN